jgi:hypothetical protein
MYNPQIPSNAVLTTIIMIMIWPVAVVIVAREGVVVIAPWIRLNSVSPCLFRSTPAAATPVPSQPYSASFVRTWLDKILNLKAQPVQHTVVNVGISDSRTPLKHNSVVLLKDILTKAECNALIEAADSSTGYEVEDSYEESALRGYEDIAADRPSVQNMDDTAKQISNQLLDGRLLTRIEQHLPSTAMYFFGQTNGLNLMTKEFMGNEPTVNRYGPGGQFERHTDGLAVTLIVVLSDSTSFKGGGTTFWSEGPEFTETTLKPQQGTGILFSGSIEHAANPVISGHRYVYVATFGLYP